MKKVIISFLFLLFVSLTFSKSLDSTYRIQVKNASQDSYLILLSNPGGTNEAWIHYSSVTGQWPFPVEIPSGNSDFGGISNASFRIQPGEQADVCAHAYMSNYDSWFAKVGSGSISVFMINETTHAEYYYESGHSRLTDDDYLAIKTHVKGDFLSFEQTDSSDSGDIQNGSQCLIQLIITK